MIEQPRKGFSLTEVAITLGVAGLVIGGIWAVSASVMEKNRVNTTVKNIMSTAYAFNHNLRGATVVSLAGASLTAYSIATKIAPAEWIKGTGLRGVWGETITIGVPSNVTASSPRVDIYIPTVPADRCRAILLEMSKFFKADAGNGLSSQVITGVWLNTTSVYAAIPATVASIDSICTVDQGLSFVVRIER